MPLPIEDLTPRQIVAELDKYIVGQPAAKRAVAVALRNRYRRQQLPEAEREDVLPKNILMMGPTGVGKTEIARRLAQLARAPFVKVEATKFTEVGYVGRDVESMVRDLVSVAVRLVEKERFEAIKEVAEKAAEDRLVELLDDSPVNWDRFRRGVFVGEPGEDEPEEEDWEAEERARQERRDQIRTQLLSGELNSRMVEIEVEEAGNPFLQVFTPGGMEEMGIDTNQLGGAFGGTRRTTRKATVTEARKVLLEEESKKLVDRSSIHREAIERAEQTGIIFLDEIDKVAGKSGGSGPDVSREGVQRDLLPIIEGSTVASKFGPIRTDHILFIAAGAFHISKPSDLIPELQGRLPIRVTLDSLSEDDFRRILLEPKNALTKQYVMLLGVEGVSVSFTVDALETIAKLAAELNTKTENIGARRLHTMMERLLEPELFDAPEVKQAVHFDAALVERRLAPFVYEAAKNKSIL
jgi:ATP-dependent HslUV protease ATP-binding subunit HslU